MSDLYPRGGERGRSPCQPTIARRAHLVAVARGAANPQEVVNSIASVYADTRSSPLFPTVARASAAGLLNLPAKPQFASGRPGAARLPVARLATKQVQTWMRLAVADAHNNPRTLSASTG